MPHSSPRQIKDIALPQLRRRDLVLRVPAVSTGNAMPQNSQLAA
ncbi:MAG: hypothetical protein WA418_14705 [Bradyrhizobium sp.]